MTIEEVYQKFNFTPAEAHVVSEVCKGKSIDEVAQDLGIVPSTVKFHLVNIYPKVGVKTKSKLIIAIEKARREV